MMVNVHDWGLSSRAFKKRNVGALDITAVE